MTKAMTETKKTKSYASTTLNVCKSNNNNNNTEKLTTLDSYLKNGYSLIAPLFFTTFLLILFFL
jgi:hypothetical protein